MEALADILRRCRLEENRHRASCLSNGVSRLDVFDSAARADPSLEPEDVDMLAHGYDQIDPEIVGDAIKNHLPGLVEVVQTLSTD